MCQWNIKLQDRLKDFPLENAEQLDHQIVARVVPKFHLAAHKEDCQTNFSLNYEPGAGRSDMEGPERTWFGLQGGGSTKDQGPGYWSDAMDDKFGHWNWSKLVRLGRFISLVSYILQLKLRFQVPSLRRSTPMPSHNQLFMQRSLLLYVPTFLRTLLTRGWQRSSHGNLIGGNQTRTSILLPVRLATHVLLSL